MNPAGSIRDALLSLASDSCSTLRRMTTAPLLASPRSYLTFVLALGLLGCKPPTEGEEEVGDTETDTGTETETTTTESTTETTTETTTDTTTEESTDTGPTCGDGMIEGDEQCEGDDLAGQDCASQGFAGGMLVCGADCMFDTAACVDMLCGDGIVQGDELCDGEDFGGATCETVGMMGEFVGGSLSCSMTCDAVGTLGCLSPGEGGVCEFNDDCPIEAPFCAAGTCWNGSETDPCDFDSECQNACVNNQCWDGSEGDPCAFDDECSEMAPFCNAVDMMCHDGGPGDACEFDSDCADGNACVQQQCYAGNEGDPCESDGDCNDGSPYCVNDVCYDGSLDDPCSNNGECNALGDAPFCSDSTDSCQSGMPGSPCSSNGDCASNSCDVVNMLCE